MAYDLSYTVQCDDVELPKTATQTTISYSSVFYWTLPKSSVLHLLFRLFLLVTVVAVLLLLPDPLNWIFFDYYFSFDFHQMLRSLLIYLCVLILVFCH